MFQDFALDLTPAIARRLIAISRLCALELDARIEAIAKDDLIDAAAFEPLTCRPTRLRRAATQFIADCGLRCAVPGLSSELNRQTIINAVVAAGATKITVATNGSKRDWRHALAGFQAAATAQVHSIKSLFEGAPQADRRDGVLILDWGMSRYGEANEQMLVALCREFPHTVIHTSFSADEQIQPRFLTLGMLTERASYPWWALGSALFPMLPRAIFDISPTTLAREFMPSPVWHRRDRDALAIFYNVFLPTELGNYAQPD